MLQSPTMRQAVLARFLRHLARKVRKSWVDKIVALSATTLYFVAHGLPARRLEFFVPLLWGVCAGVAYDAFEAAHTVGTEIDRESKDGPGVKKSAVLGPRGEPIITEAATNGP